MLTEQPARSPGVYQTILGPTAAVYDLLIFVVEGRIVFYFVRLREYGFGAFHGSLEDHLFSALKVFV